MENQSGKGSSSKVKLMCSYGGKIQPRPHDLQLAYVGGETKILAVDRRVKFSDIVAKLIALCGLSDMLIKYQLPGEDLDALVSVINDDDLEHMMDEYDRVLATSSKPARLRLFLFSPNPPVKADFDLPKTPPSSASLNPDFLFGFDKEYEYDDRQARSTQGIEISRIPDSTGPDAPGSDLRNGAVAEIQPQIQGIPYAGQGLNFCQSHVTSGSYAGGVPAGQMVYRIPVTVGGYQGGGAGQYGMQTVRLVQPVYNFVPAMPSAAEQIFGFGADERRATNGAGLEEGGVAQVATDDAGRSAIYNAVGVASPHPTVTVPATFCHDPNNNM